MMRAYWVSMSLSLGLWAGPADAAGETPASTAEEARQDLTKLSLAELATLQVTSVSRKPQPLNKTAAAVYVITQEDIRRSGAKSLPELLRQAPGVHVARINSNQWAIGIRGFTSSLARAQLALMDGRSLYTPLFAGTYWDVQDVMLEDVERIEVIRGPGGTLWGANAVNGIVNIITKDSRDTQGGLAVGGGGNEERGFAHVRYGGGLGAKGHYRVYGQYFNRDAAFHSTTDDFDAWHMYRGGFRSDWDIAPTETFTVQGDVYAGKAGRRTTYTSYEQPFSRTVEQDSELSGGYLRARWSRGFTGDSELSIRAYYDRTHRKEATFQEDRDTLDLDAQYRFPLPFRQDVVTGLEYRLSAGRTAAVPTIAFNPPDKTNDLVSAFIQDTVEIVPDRLRLIAGSKLEWNDYTGFELQPSGRLSFTPSGTQAFWLAITRAVRTPSRVDRDLILTALLPGFPGTAPAFARVLGNEQFDTERAWVYEGGYRVRFSERVMVDAAAFYSRYPNLTSLEPGPPFTELGRLIVPFPFANNLEGKVSGVEVASAVQASARWRLRASYSYLNMALEKKPGSTDSSSTAAEDSSPRHQVYLWSYLDLPGSLSLDAGYRWVARLPSQQVDAYSELDLRLAWRPWAGLEIAAVGQNLLHPHYAEFGGGTQIQRSVYGQASWSW